MQHKFKSKPGRSPMHTEMPILIVSCRPENRRMLMRAFEGLPINCHSASTLEQAKEAFRSHRFSVVFCEERLSDGSYHDLLMDVRSNQRDVRFVVMLCTADWEGYAEAMRLGAEEVLRCPLLPTDIDLALIHAVKNATQPQKRALAVPA